MLPVNTRSNDAVTAESSDEELERLAAEVLRDAAERGVRLDLEDVRGELRVWRELLHAVQTG